VGDRPAACLEVAAAVIWRDGQVLIARRLEGTHLGGYWEFPGGKRRADESWESCLRREILEELGVGLHVGELLHATVHDYDDHRVSLRFYGCRLNGGEPRPLEAAELRWVRAAALGS